MALPTPLRVRDVAAVAAMVLAGCGVQERGVDSGMSCEERQAAATVRVVDIHGRPIFADTVTFAVDGEYQGDCVRAEGEEAYACGTTEHGLVVITVVVDGFLFQLAEEVGAPDVVCAPIGAELEVTIR